MVSDDEMSGIFHAVVRTAEGRVVKYDEDEIDFWLAEFKKADTLVQVDVRELAVDEVNSMGPIYGSPGA
jgi:hypothetical protein